jgi:hypothetical protein
MKKSFRKRKYSNRKYSKKKYKTNNKKNKIKKRTKYTKRKNKKKASHGKNLLGGSGPAGFAKESVSFPDHSRCLALLDTKNNWIPIRLNIERKRQALAQNRYQSHEQGRQLQEEDSEWVYLDPLDSLLFTITNLDDNTRQYIQSNECFIQKKKNPIQQKQEHKMGARHTEYSFQITIGLSADTTEASNYLHNTKAKGMKSKLIIGFPRNIGCRAEQEYMQLLRAFPDSELTQTEESSELAVTKEAVARKEDKINFNSILDIYGYYLPGIEDKVQRFNCLVFDHVINKWTEIDVEYFALEPEPEPEPEPGPEPEHAVEQAEASEIIKGTKYFIKMGDKIFGSSTIDIVKPKNNRSDSGNRKPNYQLRLNLNPQFQEGMSVSDFPLLKDTNDTRYSHKLILGWDEPSRFEEFLEMQPVYPDHLGTGETGGDTEGVSIVEKSVSKPEPEPGHEPDPAKQATATDRQQQFEYVPIYKNTMGGTHAKTNLVFVTDRNDDTPNNVYFITDGNKFTNKNSGSSPQNGSLEGWTVELIAQENVGFRGGITGVKNPHGLIKLTAPVEQHVTYSWGNYYVGLNEGSYINPIKIVPRVGEDEVGSEEETLSLYHKLKDLSLGPIHDLYIKAVERVISKFKAAGGLNTGGVFRVKSDDLSKHSDSFDKYLSELNSDTLPNFMKYVDELPKDPLLLADLLKKMYREMPFDIISREELDILTSDNTAHFNESLVGSKRSILLNLLLNLFKEINDSSYSGEDKMTVEGLKNILVPCLKLDILIQQIVIDNGGAMDEGVRESAQEIYDKMETLILYS